MAFAPGGFIIRKCKCEDFKCDKCEETFGSTGGIYTTRRGESADRYFQQKITKEILCLQCYDEKMIDSPAPRKKSYYKPKGSKSTKDVPLQVLSTKNDKGEVETTVELNSVADGLRQDLWDAGTEQIEKWQKDPSPKVKALADKALEKRGLDSGPVICSRCGKNLLNVVHKQIKDERVCWECANKPGGSR